MATQVIKIHENVLPGAHCQENLGLLSETSLRGNSHSHRVTFIMEFYAINFAKICLEIIFINCI